MPMHVILAPGNNSTKGIAREGRSCVGSGMLSKFNDSIVDDSAIRQKKRRGATIDGNGETKIMLIAALTGRSDGSNITCGGWDEQRI